MYWYVTNILHRCAIFPDQVYHAYVCIRHSNCQIYMPSSFHLCQRQVGNMGVQNFNKKAVLLQETTVRCRPLYRRLAPKTFGKHTEVVGKPLYKCTNEGLMHVAAWYHRKPRPKFTKFRE